ncbi:MAG: hypothetical protein ACK5PZ_02210 [Pirellula sp.]
MPDARTMHRPYPPGQGAASVPVLFTLPNVQPAIAAASVKPEGVARTASPATELEGASSTPNGSMNTQVGPAVGSVNPASASAYGKKMPGTGTKVGHVTNALIGVLLLAVVSLTIRNFAPTTSKSASNPSPGDATTKLTNSSAAAQETASHASNPSATTPKTLGTNIDSPKVQPGTSAVLVASKSEGIRRSDAASPGSATADASLDAASGIAEKNEESSLPTASLEKSLDEQGEGDKENLAGSSTPVPSVPLLLPSKEPKTASGGGASLQHPQPASDASVVAPVPASGPYGTTAATSPSAVSPTAVSPTALSPAAISTPATNPVASTPVVGNTDAGNTDAGNVDAGNIAAGKIASSNQTKGNVSLTSGSNRYAENSAVGIPGAVDSDTPSLNTRDMINLRNGQRSAKGIVGGTTTVRNPAARGQEAMNPTQSMLMSGETYPPIRKQYEPINIPSNGTQAPTAYQPVYQPTLPPSTAVQSGVVTNGQGISTGGNVIAQPRVPYPGSSPASGNPAANAPSTATQQRPLQPYTPLTPTLPIPDSSGLAPTTSNR